MRRYDSAKAVPRPPSNKGGQQSQLSWGTVHKYFVLLALADLALSAGRYLGILWTLVSVDTFAVNSLTLLSTALFSWLYLGTKYSTHHFVGMATCLAGNGVVLWTTLAEGKTPTSTNPAGGFVCFLVASVFGGIFCTLVEWLIKPSKANGGLKRADVQSAELVGWVGVWGCLWTGLGLGISTAVLRNTGDGTKAGSVGDAWDALVQAGNDATLGAMLAIFVCNMTVMNVTSALLISEISASFKVVVAQARAFAVWLCSIPLGFEELSGQRLAAYCVLTGGICIYSLGLTPGGGHASSADGSGTNLMKKGGGGNRDDDGGQEEQLVAANGADEDGGGGRREQQA